MNTSAMVASDERAVRRASLRGISSPAPGLSGSAGSALSALIDAKLDGDRQIQRLSARLRDLAAQLAAAEERSRRALAQDLHDDTGAVLTAANLALARAEYWLPADAPAACADALRHAREALSDAADASHRIVAGLHAPAFDAGVGAAFAAWIAQFGERTGIRAEFACADDAPLARIAPAMSLALYRVMQEALGNVARHARAARVSVCIAFDADGVTLAVEDDGIGIGPAARRKNGRFGLAGMRARCETFGGNLRVASMKSGGASVRARLPWSASARPALRAVNG
jgi:signal transduction histidine kinase